MRNSKKAALTAATVIDGTEQTAEEKAINSVHDSIMNTAKSQGFIESYLHRGVENAISTAQLKLITGLDDRQIRKAVERERRAGVLILSCNSGYFLPQTGQAGQLEIAAFYRTAKAKAVSLLTSISVARKALGEIDGQETFDFSV